eukprot:CAMPEP_0181044924 /NCGR_PEP_ID=MMETSP1070-20121207/13528_1 /TAXON_ID=265543 /ORGANISM="Minutocellus polymorphus, Strain NH13" /LENGTH=325 /DNA_ID=CAMNT_0023123407 /DNA_START=11 /DNA_END=988 /DNA_ORIENTATION=+
MIGSSHPGDHDNIQPALRRNMEAVDSFILDYLDGGISIQEFRDFALETLPDANEMIGEDSVAVTSTCIARATPTNSPSSVKEEDDSNAIPTRETKISTAEKKKQTGRPPKPEVTVARCVDEERIVETVDASDEAARKREVEKREGACVLPSNPDELVQLHFAAMFSVSEVDKCDRNDDVDFVRRSVGHMYAGDDACSLGTFNSSSDVSNISENSGSALSMHGKSQVDIEGEKLPTCLDMIPLKHFFDVLTSGHSSSAEDQELEEREQCEEESVKRNTCKNISKKKKMQNKEVVDAELQSLIEKFRAGSGPGGQEVRALMDKYRAL